MATSPLKRMYGWSMDKSHTGRFLKPKIQASSDEEARMKCLDLDVPAQRTLFPCS